MANTIKDTKYGFMIQCDRKVKGLPTEEIMAIIDSATDMYTNAENTGYTVAELRENLKRHIEDCHDSTVTVGHDTIYIIASL